METNRAVAEPAFPGWEGSGEELDQRPVEPGDRDWDEIVFFVTIITIIIIIIWRKRRGKKLPQKLSFGCRTGIDPDHLQ